MDLADVIKGEGRRRQAGPTGQRHKGAGPPWTGTTEATTAGDSGASRQRARGAAEEGKKEKGRWGFSPRTATARRPQGGGWRRKGWRRLAREAAGTAFRRHPTMAETRPRAGGALEMTKPEEVAAQVGVDRRGGATRLDSAVAAERDGERGGGVPGAGRGNGVGAGVRRGTAMPMAVVAQRGSDGSGGGARLEVTRGGCGSGARDGGAQPELAGKRQSVGATRGER
uniref:DUF834 domain-containing protein n=1 Tax=Oryza sativa subsp. japonica TaxID=39947 RepID=Q6Z8I5_ORYSJ|nr:hypothetical protein [Oryza sativa Japonica Group]BAD15658.1 hypothetical protein [Oryza sativa Japonica Group]